MAKMAEIGWIALCAALGGCGAGAPAEARKAEAAAPAPVVPADETRRFPMDGRESVAAVAGPLFGTGFLRGGNVAVYRKGGKSWKQFAIRCEDAGAAAVLLGKARAELREAKFVAHMGGYFGMDGDLAVFVFPKGRWLAGVAGLPEKEADAAGRAMAQRLD